MNAAEPFLPRSVIRPLGWLVGYLAVFAIGMLLLFQSMQQHEVIVGTLGDSSVASLLQRLEQLDINYRIGTDGAVKADARDRERLAEAGVIPTDANLLPLRLYQAALLILLLLFAALIFTNAKRVFILLKQGAAVTHHLTMAEGDEAASEPDAEAMRTATPARRIVTRENAWRGVFENEHPQVIAIYLLGLNPEEAATAMEALDASMRDAVWERMVLSRACDPEIENMVNALVSQKREAVQMRIRPAERTEKIAAIYRLLSNDTRKAFLVALRKANPDDPLVAVLEAETRVKQVRKEAS